jgi:gliding motility-associated-like protein
MVASGNAAGAEVQTLCNAQAGQSNCNVANGFPGVKVFIDTCTITLTDTCSNWKISWTDGARNVSISNLQNPGNQSIYIESIINNTIAPGFTLLPTITAYSDSICAGGSDTLRAPLGYTTYAWSGGGSSPTKVITTPGTYTVTVTGNGVTGTASINITAAQAPVAPTITASGSTTICPHTSVVLRSSAKGGNTWSTGQKSDTIIVTQAGSYTVTHTNTCGSLTSAPTVVTVTPVPAAVTPAGPIAVCTGPVALTASGGVTYQWFKNGAIIAGANTAIYNATTTGNYTCVVVTAGGCADSSNTVRVDIGSPNLAPRVTANLPYLCPSATDTLDAGAGYATYTWSGGLGSARYAYPTAAGTYRVTVTAAGGCTGVDSFTITARTAPAVPTTSPAGSPAICPGASIVITSSASSSYLWSTGETTQAITVSTPGAYTVTVNNGCGTAASVPVNVTNTAVTATISPANTVILPRGGSQLLTASGGGTYQWYQDGVPMPGRTAATLTVYVSGNYSVRVTNSGCSVTSTPTFVQIAPNYINNSVTFLRDPVPFVCLNTNCPITYTNSAVDANGDSLVYTLADPLTAANTPIQHQSQWSSTQPIRSNPPVTLDSTGLMTFQPTSTEIDVITFLVREYRNGVLVGSVMRDVQLNVYNCTALCLPDPTPPQNLNNADTTNAGSSGSTVKMCPGTAASFDIQMVDPGGRNITLASTIGGTPSAVPGATFTQVGTGDSVIARITWTPTLSDTGCYAFEIRASTQDCPVPQSIIKSYRVCVLNKVSVTPHDAIYCGTPIQLTATGGSNALWFSNPPGNGGLSYPTTIYSPVAAPSATTLYRFISDCGTDTALIRYDPPFTMSAGLDASICQNGQAQLLANVDTIYKPYHIQWTPSRGLLDPITGTPSDTILNPIASPQSTTSYVVSFTANTGCVRKDTVKVTVNGFAPAIRANADPTIVCPGQPTTLTALASPAVCGAATTPCTGGTVVQVGTGTTNQGGSGFVYPSPYGTYYKSARHQFLIHANELASLLGGAGGQIKSLAMKIGVLNSGSQCVNFTIKMACIDPSIDSLTGYISTPLTTVYVQNYTPVNGWNVHNFQTPYDWDGTSNLLIDICFLNTTNGTPNNKMVYSTTPYRSVWWTYTNVSSGVCGVTGSQAVAPVYADFFRRPNFQFNVCTTKLDNANLHWTPDTGPNAAVTPLNDTSKAYPIDQTTYQVELQDTNGCKSQDFVTVFVDTTNKFRVTQDTFLCSSQAVQLHAILTTGTNPALAVYTWTATGGATAPASGTGPGFANPTVTPLATATYICKVTPTTGCEITDSATVTIGNSIPITKVVDSISCHGAADGQIHITMGGGVPPYTYVWSPAAGNVDSLINLGPGTYILSVTDNTGCAGTDTTKLIDPIALTIVMDSTNVNCKGAADGSVTANVGGGRPGYTYVWIPAQGNIKNPTNIGPGLYSVVATDAAGCTISGQVNVTQPTAVTSSAVSTDLTGVGTNDGTITLTTSGGTPGYTYTSVPSVTGLPAATGLDTGTYIITVCDSKNCCVKDTAVITVPPPINVTAIVTNNTCHGNCLGDITVSAAGGILPYHFNWSTNPGVDTFNNVSALCAGSYTVTVTDSNGISVTKVIAVTEPPALNIFIDSTVITCFGAANGTLRDSVAGGTPGYTSVWTPGGANPISNLAPGMYVVDVTDSKGCTAKDTAYLGEPAQLVASIAASDSAKCFGQGNGYAKVQVVGGRSPFTYAWSGSSSTADSATDLSAGQHIVTVTDAGGCSDTALVTIDQPLQILVTVDTVAAHCATSADGSAQAHVSNGTPSYSYVWDAVAGSSSVFSLNGGLHTLSVTDANGCGTSINFHIDTLYVVHVTLDSTDLTCFGSNNGTATATPTILAGNPAPVYTYLWTPSNLATNPANNLSAGMQTVVVTDQYGCRATDSIEIHQPAAITVVHGSSNPLCAGDSKGRAWVGASGGAGGYTFTWYGTSHPITDTITGLRAATYYYTVYDVNGCSQADTITLTDPVALTLTSSVIDISCANFANGRIEINAAGGTPPYSYLWTPGGYTDSIQNSLAPGTYSVLVTDANGCTQTTSRTLLAPPPITATRIVSDSTSCPDSKDGHIVMDVVGGTPGSIVPYRYSLDGISAWQDDHNFYDLAAGSYHIYVADSQACQFDTTIQVYSPLPVSASIMPLDSSVTVGTSLQLTTILANYGSQTINSYSWSPSTGLSCIDCPNPVATAYATTEYQLTINYGHNCITHASAHVVIAHGPDVYIPNAFTPNGDGANDVFEVYGTTLRSVAMRVFNRWGEKVFDSMDSQWATWDGTYKGVLQSSGVYVYVVDLVYLDGVKKTREGSVTLIR